MVHDCHDGEAEGEGSEGSGSERLIPELPKQLPKLSTAPGCACSGCSRRYSGCSGWLLMAAVAAVAALFLALASASRLALRGAHALANAEVGLQEVSLLPKVTVAPYGVLGVQLDASHRFVRAAAGPNKHTVIVDPAGLRFIQDLGPAGAGAASGAIYSWLKIGLNAQFPADVRREVRREGDAKLHKYGHKQVIHVVGPDLNDASVSTAETRAPAVEKLTAAYLRILKEFLSSNAAQLRLLPVSGGIFAGPFQKDLPKMTFASLDAAFQSLPALGQSRLLRREVKMCIFDQSQLQEFEAACPTCVRLH